MAEETPKVEKKERRKRTKALVLRGKRKRAVARATITAGSGKLLYNGVPAGAVDNPFVKEMLFEPVELAGGMTAYDIRVNVRGGGVMGQAQAARTAIARALAEFSKDASLKQRLLETDRSLLVEDPRRVEPKKFKGPKARARFTKSYR